MPELSEVQDIIERLGNFFEKRGLSPVIGKVLGILHFRGPLTQDEIKETIGCSLSAVSQAISFLKSLGIANGEKGEGRKKLYSVRFADNNFKNILQNMLLFEIDPMINLLNEKEKIISSSELKEKTKSLKSFYENFKEKISKIKEL